MAQPWPFGIGLKAASLCLSWAVHQQNVTNSAMIRAVDTKPIHPPHPSGHRYAPIPRPDFCGRIALVLQGGGALGAYQGGVYQALNEAGLEPEWVSGVSIGAI